MGISARRAGALSVPHERFAESELERLIGFSDLRPPFQYCLKQAALAQTKKTDYEVEPGRTSRWDLAYDILEAGKPLIDLFRQGTVEAKPRTTRPHTFYDVHVREAAVAGLANAAELLNTRTEPLFKLRFLLHLAHDGGEDHTGLPLTREERIELYDNAILESLSASCQHELEERFEMKDLRTLVHEVNEKLTMGRRLEGAKEPYSDIIGYITRTGSMPGRILALDTKVSDRFAQANEFEIVDSDVQQHIDTLLPGEHGFFDRLMDRLAQLPTSSHHSHARRMAVITSINHDVTKFTGQLDELRRYKANVNWRLAGSPMMPDGKPLGSDGQPRMKPLRARARAHWEWNVEHYKGQVLTFKIGHFAQNQFLPLVRSGSALDAEKDIFGMLILNSLAYDEERSTEAIRLERLITLTGNRDRRAQPLSMLVRNRHLHELAQAYMETEDSRRFQMRSRSGRDSVYRFNNTFGTLNRVEANINGSRREYAAATEEQLADVIIIQEYARQGIDAKKVFLPLWFKYRSGELDGAPSGAELQYMHEDFSTKVQEWERK